MPVRTHVTGNASGSTRVSATEVMKFESALQRGITWTWTCITVTLVVYLPSTGGTLGRLGLGRRPQSAFVKGRVDA